MADCDDDIVDNVIASRLKSLVKSLKKKRDRQSTFTLLEKIITNIMNHLKHPSDTTSKYLSISKEGGAVKREFCDTHGLFLEEIHDLFITLGFVATIDRMTFQSTNYENVSDMIRITLIEISEIIKSFSTDTSNDQNQNGEDTAPGSKIIGDRNTFTSKSTGSTEKNQLQALKDMQEKRHEEYLRKKENGELDEKKDSGEKKKWNWWPFSSGGSHSSDDRRPPSPRKPRIKGMNDIRRDPPT